MSNAFGMQFLIPLGKDVKFTIAISCGALTNFVLNLILIYFYASYGAAISTVIAEIIVTFVMFIFIKKYIKFKGVLINAWKYIASGAIMFFACFFFSRNLNSSILNTFLIVIIGIMVYFVCLVILRDYYTKKMFNFFKRRVRI